MNTLLVLLPDFAIVALGALLAPLLPPDGWRALDRLSYHVLYPALLFGAAASRPIAPGALLAIGGLACAIVTLGFVAVAALPPGASGVLAISVGLGIPLANLYAVGLLARGRALSRLSVLREIALNPFLLASLGGVLFGLGGLSLPAPVAGFVARLADAALPVVLLSLGAALRGARVWPPTRFALALHAVRLLVLPGTVWAIAQLTRSHGLVPATLLVFAALPTATAAHVLAARYGAERGGVALLVMQSSLFGLVTLPLWSLLAVRLAVP